MPDRPGSRIAAGDRLTSRRAGEPKCAAFWGEPLVLEAGRSGMVGWEV